MQEKNYNFFVGKTDIMQPHRDTPETPRIIDKGMDYSFPRTFTTFSPRGEGKIVELNK